MSPSVERARDEALELTARLEDLCGELEGALTAREWDLLAEGLLESRRVTHALQNAMEVVRAAGDEAFERSILERLHEVHARREDQLRRLQWYREAVGERLRTIGKWRRFARAIGTPNAARRSVGLDGFR